MIKSRTTHNNGFDLDAAVRHMRDKFHRQKKQNLQRWRRAKRDAEAIIDMIIKKYRPEKIYQWGSVLDPEHFNEMSDIDIAVLGVQNVQQFFIMYGEADSMTKFSLDLVDLQKIMPEYASLIKRKGRLVYERE